MARTFKGVLVRIDQNRIAKIHAAGAVGHRDRLLRHGVHRDAEDIVLIGPGRGEISAIHAAAFLRVEIAEEQAGHGAAVCVRRAGRGEQVFRRSRGRGAVRQRKAGNIVIGRGHNAQFRALVKQEREGEQGFRVNRHVPGTIGQLRHDAVGRINGLAFLIREGSVKRFPVVLGQAAVHDRNAQRVIHADGNGTVRGEGAACERREQQRRNQQQGGRMEMFLQWNHLL